MANRQADKEQTQQRVEVVYRLILQGDSIPNIVENCGKTWGVKKSQAYGYVKRARTLIRKEAERIRTQAFDEHLAARRRMRKEAHDAKDGRLAFDLLRDEAKLLDLYPAQKSKQEALNIDVAKLTDEQLDRIIAGEDPLIVLATSSQGAAGKEPAASAD